MAIEYTSGHGFRTHPVTGKPPRCPWDYTLTVHEMEENKKTTPNEPTLLDVLYSLVTDSSGVRHGQSFEEWCGEYGYDTDSRSAEKVFDACVDQWRNLIRLDLDLDAMEILFEDY